MKDFWEGMTLKIRKRLTKCKGKIISLTGRMCLIKSILSTLLLFLLSIFNMLKGVWENIIQIQR